MFANELTAYEYSCVQKISTARTIMNESGSNETHNNLECCAQRNIYPPPLKIVRQIYRLFRVQLIAAKYAN